MHIFRQHAPVCLCSHRPGGVQKLECFWAWYEHGNMRLSAADVRSVTYPFPSANPQRLQWQWCWGSTVALHGFIFSSRWSGGGVVAWLLRLPAWLGVADFGPGPMWDQGNNNGPQQTGGAVVWQLQYVCIY